MGLPENGVTPRTGAPVDENEHRKQLAREHSPTGEVLTISVGMTFEEVEKLLITATLQHTDGNISESARILGIDRATLYHKVKRYGIPR